MVENAGRKVFLIVALVIASIALLVYKPLTSGRSPFPLGLDIAGGERLLYRINLEEAARQGLIVQGGDPSELMQQTIAVIRQRCDNSGNTEAIIRRLGTDRIEVSLPRMSSVRSGLVTASLRTAVAAEGLPAIELDASEETLRSFPGSGGVIRIDGERMTYASRVGNAISMAVPMMPLAGNPISPTLLDAALVSARPFSIPSNDLETSHNLLPTAYSLRPTAFTSG